MRYRHMTSFHDKVRHSRHNGAVNRPEDSACSRHDCHACCVETRMTLTEADVGRLEGAGFRDFARLNEDGDLELVNPSGSCMFLDRGRCGVYELRPEGCRFYPLVVDLGTGRVVRDEFCPFRDDFSMDGHSVRELKRSVEREAAEAAARRRRADG